MDISNNGIASVAIVTTLSDATSLEIEFRI